jgi:hypothetical protein
MSALIPAIISLILSRKGGGGGGGYGGGGGGGGYGRGRKPERSTEEKSDYYWTGEIMKGDIGESLTKRREAEAKSQPRSGIIPYAQQEAEARGRGR